MCRYIAYLGNPIVLEDIVYRPPNSLIHQSMDAMQSPTRINADGFGVGWYNPAVHPEPAVFKDTSPAWNNANLGSLAGKVASGCILAHVRAAQRFDPVNRANCHPFQNQRVLWMHNGDVPGRARLHRRVVEAADDEIVARIRGGTDSELSFALFLTHLKHPTTEPVPEQALVDAMRATIEQIVGWHEEDNDERHLVLNFCVTDGRRLVASRYARNVPESASLFYAAGGRYVCDPNEGCWMEPNGNGPADPSCVILASERLSLRAPWERVEEDHLVVIAENHEIEQQHL